MADIRRDIGMAKENWPPAIRAAPLQPNAPNILFKIAEILCATKIYLGTEFSCEYRNIQPNVPHIWIYPYMDISFSKLGKSYV